MEIGEEKMSETYCEYLNIDANALSQENLAMSVYELIMCIDPEKYEADWGTLKLDIKSPGEVGSPFRNQCWTVGMTVEVKKRVK